MQDIQTRFEDCYAGEWSSEIEYTESLIEDGVFGDATEGTLGNYIDVQSLSRDLFMSDVMSIDIPTGGVFVFHNC
jgi:antirestriction protein